MITQSVHMKYILKTRCSLLKDIVAVFQMQNEAAIGVGRGGDLTRELH